MALAILRLNMIRFNTSHVVVYRTKTTDNFGYVASFNTSHVVVYLISAMETLLPESSFNTSHVVVYLVWRKT